MPTAGAAEPLLSVAIAEKRFAPVDARTGEGTGPATVLRDLAFELGRRELLVLLGPSGCGKTTTLNIVAGLDRDYSGEIVWHGEARSVGARPPIGYVFQSPRLLPWRTLEENLRLVMPDPEAGRPRLERLLEITGLTEARHLHPTRLSLGMARRAAIARAFVIQPAVLLMDEPFVSLDEATAGRLRRLLLEILAEQPTAVIFVTHDLREALGLADRIGVLSGTPTHLLEERRLSIPKAERDAAWVEEERRGLIARHPTLFGHAEA